jgi:protein involved in ribonucleotide reduction
MIAYFSTKSRTTARFVSKLDIPNIELGDSTIIMASPYILITPTYGGGMFKNSVPSPVIKFLNNSINRSLLRGVISTGNRDYGHTYCVAGDVISAKCNVPHLYKLEMLGTPEDVNNVRSIISKVLEGTQ